jgi:general L-amino acid transport system permease protein
VLVAALVVDRIALRRELRTGRSSYPVIWAVVTVVFIGAVAWFAVGGAPLVVEVPQPEGRFGHLKGGVSISIELAALLVGLIIYTSSFIAEIVRAGLQSVSLGQGEASRSLGLNTLETLRYVTFPQALRVIVPPLISQYLNLTKNSSLAVAIGYADLTSVAKTMVQTAPAISIFLAIMAIYLLFSLGYSLIGNLYNRHIQFKGG